MSANGDLLRQLFRGHVRRDDALFRSTAESIVQDERAKNHRLLADDLERILRNGNGHGDRHLANTYEIPKDRERGFPLLDIVQFDYDWDRIILPSETISALQQITVEHKKRDVLAAYGIKPKQNVLFYGPPGCGKTLAAQVLSGILNYPLVTVRFDAVVSSFLGETAANLRRVFEFIQRGQWVVLFDEFDAIGKDRDNPFEHGELKRVVNSLLQLMDFFEGESLLIAATNHEGLLDQAIWRRFDVVISFDRPKDQDRILMLRLFLRSFITTALDLNSISRRIKGATGADIEWIALELARKAVLELRNEILPIDIEPVIKQFQSRQKLIQGLYRERMETKDIADTLE